MKPNIKQKAQNLLKSAKLRRTKPRIAVLAALLSAKKPLTQDHIAAKLGPKAPNKVTIYRTLQTLLNADIIHKAYLQKRTWHFELAHNCSENQCHPHFTCTNCGDTHCLTQISMPMAKSPHTGFVIDHQRIQLEGLCPKCSTTP